MSLFIWREVMSHSVKCVQVEQVRLGLTHCSRHGQVTDVLDLELLDLLPNSLQKLHWNTLNEEEWAESQSESSRWCQRTGESPCLGRSSGEMLSMVRERDGLISAFSDIIYRWKMKTHPRFYSAVGGFSVCLTSSTNSNSLVCLTSTQCATHRLPVVFLARWHDCDEVMSLCRLSDVIRVISWWLESIAKACRELFLLSLKCGHSGARRV